LIAFGPQGIRGVFVGRAGLCWRPEGAHGAAPMAIGNSKNGNQRTSDRFDRHA
jgi:hypothetical protein